MQAERRDSVGSTPRSGLDDTPLLDSYSMVPPEEEAIVVASLEDERQARSNDEGGKTSAGFGKLMWYTLLLLITSVGNSIYFKKMTDHLGNYLLFLNVATTVVYVPIFGGIVAYTMVTTNSITPAMRKFPKRKFFVMGALDSAAGLLMIFGGAHTSGSLQAPLGQFVIPTTMLLSYIVLRQHYNRFQLLGAGIILLGVGFVLAPKVINPGDDATSNSIVFNIIFLMGAIPTAFSSVYKEIAFTEEMDVNYLQFYVAIFQLLFAFVLSPANALKVLGPNRVPLDQIPVALWNGLKCVGGENSIVTQCLAKPPPHSTLPQCDMCPGAWVPLASYLVFNCMYNIFIMLVIKHGSAALVYIASTLRLPLVNIAFTIRQISNPPDELHWNTYVGLVTIMTGLGIYRGFTGKPAADAEEDMAVVPGALEPLAITLQRKRAPVPLNRSQQMIRSGFYGRLGITNSPNSTRFMNSFKEGSPIANFSSRPV